MATTLAAFAVALAVVAAALALLTVRAANAQAVLYEARLDTEQGRVSDLLNRLAARNLPEYQVFSEPQEVPEAKTYRFDEWGLTSDEAD